MYRVCLALLVASIVGKSSGKDFVDSFEEYDTETGTGAIVGDLWQRYWKDPYHANLHKDSNHAHSGKFSALAKSGDPYSYSSFADFGTTSDSIRAEVYVFEDLTFDGSDPANKPVTCMLALIGDADTPHEKDRALTDYLQLGVVSTPPSSCKMYCIRTRYGDKVEHQDIIDTGVGRKKGAWTKLAIEVDSLGKGGEARFYIDDKQVGTSYRAGAKDGAGGLKPVNLRWVRLGNEKKSYENFWYDDVSVKPIKAE